MPTPRYLRQPPQASLTGKIPVTGDPVAGALTQLGGAVRGAAGVAGQMKKEADHFKDMGYIATANAGRIEALSSLEDSFQRGLVSVDGAEPEFQIEQKTENIAAGLELWGESLSESWQGSDKALQSVLANNEVAFANTKARNNREILEFQLERSLVAQQMEIETMQKQSFDFRYSGDHESADKVDAAIDAKYEILAQSVGAKEVAQMRQGGYYTASATMIKSSNNIEDVEDVEELIDSNKDRYSVEQYAELKYYVESQKQQFMAQAYAGVSKILKAVGNGEASSVEGLDALQQYEAEMPGIVNYATKVIIGQYRDSVDEDPSVVKDTRKEYPKYEKAQDGVEDYLTLRHMIGFRPNIKENEVRLNEVMNLIEECDAPIEVKYQMTQDVLKDAERMFKPGFGVEAGKRGGGEARSKAYKQLKKTMNDHVAATGDTSIYKRMGTSLYEMYSIMNEDPEFDYNVYIKETFSDLISQTQQARSDSMFLSSLSPKARAQRTGGKTIVRTGMQDGRRVIQYSDGSIEYGD